MQQKEKISFIIKFSLKMSTFIQNTQHAATQSKSYVPVAVISSFLINSHLRRAQRNNN